MMLTHCGNNVRNRYSGCVFSVKDIVPVPLKTSRNPQMRFPDQDHRLHRAKADRGHPPSPPPSGATAGQVEEILGHCGLWKEESARAPPSVQEMVES